MSELKQGNSRAGVWLRRAAEVLVFIALVAGIRAWQQRDIPAGSAPALQGALLGGNAFALPLRPRSPLLVHFWATWCPVCRTDQASFQDLARTHPDVVTVAMRSGSREAVEKFMRRQGLDFRVLNDPDGRIAAAWGVHAVPASFVVDTRGRIRFVEFGYTTEMGLRLRLWLAQF